MTNSDWAQLSVCPPVVGSFRPPGSKSLTNRAVLCAALARGTSILSGVLDSEDTQFMVYAWRDLGLDLDWDRTACQIKLHGGGGQIPNDEAELFIGNSGTTIRFLTAALSATHGRFVLDGVPRMRQRPIQDLLNGLSQLGGNVVSLNDEHPDCPPVEIRGQGLKGGVARIAGNISSQFLSGLMMAAPYAKSDVVLEVQGELVSLPYVAMTAAVMKSFGVEVEGQANGPYRIAGNQTYQACNYAIEPDASAASYFLAAAAITQGNMRVLGLGENALQGDVGFARVLEQMGCEYRCGSDWIEIQGRPLRGIDVDMNKMSDTVQTLAVVALFAEGPTRVRGVAHNRYKETDRIGDLASELRRVGALVTEHDDGLTIEPGTLRPGTIETYNDHRMAMSFALAGLRVDGIRISNPICTEKTYPNYFDDMAYVTGSRLLRNA